MPSPDQMRENRIAFDKAHEKIDRSRLTPLQAENFEIARSFAERGKKVVFNGYGWTVEDRPETVWDLIK